jgi:hypothetical protein
VRKYVTVSSSYSGGSGFVDGEETTVAPEVCREFPYSLKTTARVVTWGRSGEFQCSLEFIVTLVAVKSVRKIQIIFFIIPKFGIRNYFMQTFNLLVARSRGGKA